MVLTWLTPFPDSLTAFGRFTRSHQCFFRLADYTHLSKGWQGANEMSLRGAFFATWQSPVYRVNLLKQAIGSSHAILLSLGVFLLWYRHRRYPALKVKAVISGRQLIRT